MNKNKRAAIRKNILAPTPYWRDSIPFGSCLIILLSLDTQWDSSLPPRGSTHPRMRLSPDLKRFSTSFTDVRVSLVKVCDVMQCGILSGSLQSLLALVSNTSCILIGSFCLLVNESHVHSLHMIWLDDVVYNFIGLAAHGETPSVFFNISGHGHVDLSSFVVPSHVYSYVAFEHTP